MGEQVDREGAVAYVKSVEGGIVLEERAIGEEFTLQAFVDGNHLIPMPLVQDHKRAFEGDAGLIPGEWVRIPCPITHCLCDPVDTTKRSRSSKR